jgi:Eukaryotic aspartyl protease
MKYPFLMVEHAIDLQDPSRSFPHDGILGLSPDVDGDDYITLGVPMPVHMKRKKRINRAVVAVDMKKGDDQTSTLELGKISYDKFRYKGEDENHLGWVTVPTNTTRFSWRTEMKNIFYNRTSFNDTKFEEKSIDDGFQNNATFDSFYGGIHLPIDEWVPLFQMETLNLKGKGVELKCSRTTYSCYFDGLCKPELFANFGFNFVDNRAYILQPKDYLI